MLSTRSHLDLRLRSRLQFALEFVETLRPEWFGCPGSFGHQVGGSRLEGCGIKAVRR